MIFVSLERDFARTVIGSIGSWLHPGFTVIEVSWWRGIGKCFESIREGGKRESTYDSYTFFNLSILVLKH